MKNYILLVRFGFLVRSNLLLENEVKALYMIEIDNINYNITIRRVL